MWFLQYIAFCIKSNGSSWVFWPSSCHSSINTSFVECISYSWAVDFCSSSRVTISFLADFLVITVFVQLISLANVLVVLHLCLTIFSSDLWGLQSLVYCLPHFRNCALELSEAYQSKRCYIKNKSFHCTIILKLGLSATDLNKYV